jgi:hypothetical protein
MNNRLQTPDYSAFAKNLRNYKIIDTSGMGYHSQLASKEMSLKELQRNRC